MKFRPSYGNGTTVYWEYMGSRQRQCNDFLLIGDEDVHHAAGWTDNGGVEEDRLSWGLRRFLMTSTQTFSEVICSFVPVSFHGLMRKRTVYATRVNTAQKHDRLKHGTCLFWDLFCQWRQQGGILCACVVCGPEEKCAKTKTLHVFLSFNSSCARCKYNTSQS